MTGSAFLPESSAYALLARAGLQPPRHAVADGPLPFTPGEPVVLKGLADGLWHKTEVGAVRFLDFEPATVSATVTTMRTRVEAAGFRWLHALVCERVALARNGSLPTEGFVSLTRGEAGWSLLCGCGGLQAEALATLAPPCRWPLEFTTPEEALGELETHLLGRVWLGRLRGTTPLTSPVRLLEFLRQLWSLPALLDAEEITLLELNPVALDETGRPRPLDAAGTHGPISPPRRGPDPTFLSALLQPARVALAGVSAQPGGVGRTILANLQRARLPAADLVLIKPGRTEFLGHPCLPDLTGLRAQPVDLLLLALSAAAALDTLGQLVDQGGGARCVGLVAGGIGDGADHDGRAVTLSRLLHEARAEGRWTPAVLGPNFLGHWVPARHLDTSFIPADRVPPLPEFGRLHLLSQSGAFLLCRRAQVPHLPLRLGLALGNQLDVSLGDVLAGLATLPSAGPVACYLEGFGPDRLLPAARAIRQLTRQGRTVLLHRAGHTSGGQAAAASHTGAMTSDFALERALLSRAGARFAPTIAEFDAALAWLAAWPELKPGPVAVLTNAGFESVSAGDLLGTPLAAAELSPADTTRLHALLEKHDLADLVAPRLPLDLTPMADTAAFLAAADLLLESASVLVVGLVPFTPRLDPSSAAATGLAEKLAALAQRHGKPLGIAVDAGADYEPLRAAFTAAHLPVFPRLEAALHGLRTLAG